MKKLKFPSGRIERISCLHFPREIRSRKQINISKSREQLRVVHLVARIYTDSVAMNMHCGQQNLLDKPSLLFVGPRHLIK